MQNDDVKSMFKIVVYCPLRTFQQLFFIDNASVKHKIKRLTSSLFMLWKGSYNQVLSIFCGLASSATVWRVVYWTLDWTTLIHWYQFNFKAFLYDIIRPMNLCQLFLSDKIITCEVSPSSVYPTSPSSYSEQCVKSHLRELWIKLY